MHTIDRRIRHQRLDDAHEPAILHPKFSHATWGAIAVGVIGAGVTAYGANKQAKSQSAANAANQQSVAQADNSAWTSYLLSRGMAYDQPIATGTVPTTGGRAINTRLPIWASTTSNPTQNFSGSVVRRKTPRVA